MSKKELTGQLVVVQTEVCHASAEPELRRDVACAAIRSCLVRGTLVYQTGQDEHKIGVPVSWLSSRRSQFIALQRPSSVGIRPVKYLIERLSAEGLLVYRTGQDEHKIDVPISVLPVSSSQFIALQRPSSVGIRPVKKLIERLSAESLLADHSRQFEHKISVPVTLLSVR